MASFNFKSSGNRISDRDLESKNTVKQRDIGIKTPLTNYQGRQIFDMHNEITSQVKDNLKNLLLTNAGERLGLYDFGADLNALLFDLSSNSNVQSEFVDRINAAVQKYMPGLEVEEVEEVELEKTEKKLVNESGMAKVRLRIKFNIPAARIGNQAIEVTLQAGG